MTTKTPAEFTRQHDGKRFHVRVLNGEWQVYAAGVEHICMCTSPEMADMVAAALENAACQLTRTSQPPTQYAIVSDLCDGAFAKHGIGGYKPCVQIHESETAAKEFANNLIATKFPEQQADWEEAELTPLEWVQEGMRLGETLDVYPVVTNPSQ